MQIANPIYDVVFKHLMENHEVVKLLTSTIVGERIVNGCPKATKSSYYHRHE